MAEAGASDWDKRAGRRPRRTYFPKEGLSLLAEYRVPTTRELEDQEVKRTRVWSLDA